MADEAIVRISLTMKSGYQDYRNNPTSFNADVANPAGPTPGYITASTAGTDVDLSELANPGLCVIQNVDDTNYVHWGIWDPENALFFPIGKLLPGEMSIIRLADNFGVEYQGTGPGTGPHTNRLRIKANTAACGVKVEAFDS